jgi:predicted porin
MLSTHTNVSGAATSAANANTSTITTGLLPNFLSVSGKTRQNDLDVAFTISIQPGAARAQALTDGSQAGGMSNRQAFLSFGDASWGSIKLGKDLGIYASDAILSDMTLLGVGAGGANASGNTTLGRIGYGYQYADWKSQIAYTTPNFNGFSATAGITQPWSPSATNQTEPAFEGKASYAWTGDVAGKVWVSGITQNVDLSVTSSQRVHAWDMGANVTVAGLTATAYYGQGKGTGTLGQMTDTTAAHDNQDWYLQATYVLPTTTKIGVSYGESEIDVATNGSTHNTNTMWTVGAYHPLTKHLNLVAEYSTAENETTTAATVKKDTVSLGAILFF